MNKTNEIENKAQSQLSEKIFNLFDSVIAEREKHFQEHPTKPDITKVEDIISKYANYNFGISGGIGLIPGPLGMIAAVPEIAMIIRNQFAMIYDIGHAYGKAKVMNKELMAGIFLASLGTKGIGVLTMHGSKIFVKRASLRVFQKMVQVLGGKILQRAARAMITKWLPIVGAAAMAVWSRYTTKELGNYAIKILEREIIQKEDEFIDSLVIDTEYQIISEDTKLEINLDELKIQALINLMKIDNEIHKKEIEFIETVISNVDLDETTIDELRQSFESKKISDIDYILFKQSPDLSIGLLSDLVGLAKRDGKLHPKEKLFLKNVAKQLEISEQDLDELLSID